MDLFKNIYTFKDIGKRKIQEDNFFFFSFKDLNNNVFNTIFIFDGHGAKDGILPLPDFIIKEKILVKKFNEYFATQIVTKQALTNLFLELDSNLRNKINKNIGTCFSAIILTQECFFTLILGDTSINIFDTDNNLFFKTTPHNFKNNEELQRYKNNKEDKYIKNDRYKGLLMTRTLGDFDCKTIGSALIPIPDIKKFYNNKDFIFVLKTDGIITASKILVSKYKDGLITDFLEKKEFQDNACLIIFSTKYINSKSLKGEKIILENLEYETMYYNFLLYVYND